MKRRSRKDFRRGAAILFGLGLFAIAFNLAIPESGLLKYGIIAIGISAVLTIFGILYVPPV